MGARAYESEHRAARKEQADGQRASLLGVQRALGPASSGRAAEPAAVGEALAGPGRALEPAVRADMGRHFGHDFSLVRVHTDAKASESARAVGARAYTVGSHVVFGEGQYDASGGAGRKLLAHELAHTIQQSAFASAPVPRSQPIAVEPAGTSFERAAEESAARVADGVQGLAPAPRLALQRQPLPQGEQTTKPAQFGDFLNRMRQFPTYIDNEIKEVNYFTAEMAHIHYRDGTKFELGLVSKWMKPPVVEVDYGTPLEEIRPFEDPVTKRVGFMLERELASAPRTMPFGELVKKYVHFVDFYVEKGTGRVVPSRINMLTAPTLCAVLLDSFRQYEENVRLGAYIGYHGTAVIGAYAGQGGIPKTGGLGPTTFFTKTAPRVLTPTGKKLWAEMDDLLTQGGTKTLEVEGTKFIDVTVAKQGSTLAVRRFKSEVPANLRGGGMGTRLAKDFEDAAVELGRANGAKQVTVDVGIVTNPGWREVLEARGYIYTPKEGGWIKTIKVPAE